MEIGQETTLYVKALSNQVWFGGWAPVRARLEWLRPDGQMALFTLTETGLDEDDEYAFYQAGCLIIAERAEEGFRALAGALPHGLMETEG